MAKLALALISQWGWLITLLVVFCALPWLGAPAGWWFASHAYPELVPAMKIEPLEHPEAFKAGICATFSLLGGAACMGLAVMAMLVGLRVWIQRKEMGHWPWATK